MTDKLGCQIIDNSLLIKLEKIPVIPEQFMGIGPVSYTHLDVYKRQDLNSVKAEEMMRTKEFLVFKDVYKRQKVYKSEHSYERNGTDTHQIHKSGLPE